MARPASVGRELVSAIKLGEAGDLRWLLREQPEAVVGFLGLDRSSLNRLEKCADSELLDVVGRRLVRCSRDAARAACDERASMAASAAERLRHTARWNGTAVHVEPQLLLGDVLRHPTAKLVAFWLDDGQQVAVELRTLRAAARAAGRFGDLRAAVDAQGVHLRWRGNPPRGGLDFWPGSVPRGVDVVPIDLTRPVPVEVPPAVIDVPPIVRSPRRAGSWLRDVLVELGLGA